MGTKNLYKNGSNPFFFFQSHGNGNGPESSSQRNKTRGFVFSAIDTT